MQCDKCQEDCGDDARILKDPQEEIEIYLCEKCYTEIVEDA